MILRILFFYVVVSLMACQGKSTKVLSTATSKPSTNYQFDFQISPTLSPVLDMAGVENKLVYLDVSAEWCVPCQLMKRDVYTHRPTADFFNKNFINYLVDVEKEEGPDLKIIFNIKSYPTLLILDSKGRVVSRHEGAYYHNDLISFAKESLLKAN